MLFFNYLFPLIFFFAFAELFHAGAGAGIAYFVGTVLAMGILGNGLWGAGMRSVQEREANILRRFKVTPISPLPILVAAMVSGWLLYLPVPSSCWWGWRISSTPCRCRRTGSRCS